MQTEATQAAFFLFDRDKNGWIDRKELANALSQCFDTPVNMATAVKVFKDCDRNGDGKIDYEDFCFMVAGLQDREKLDAQSMAAFTEIDKNGDGHITPDELRRVMLKECTGTLALAAGSNTQRDIEKGVENLMASADQDGDGRISYAEFATLMTDKKEQTPVSYGDVVVLRNMMNKKCLGTSGPRKGGDPHMRCSQKEVSDDSLWLLKEAGGPEDSCEVICSGSNVQLIHATSGLHLCHNAYGEVSLKKVEGRQEENCWQVVSGPPGHPWRMSSINEVAFVRVAKQSTALFLDTADGAVRLGMERHDATSKPAGCGDVADPVAATARQRFFVGIICDRPR
jgi:Ca2+-binding EF-hand superfamily protein